MKRVSARCRGESDDSVEGLGGDVVAGGGMGLVGIPEGFSTSGA